jgi:NDP-sugar pyrophosphorylase family protein
MVLGAGRGTRLAGVAPGVPKVLVEIGGEPLLEHQLRYLTEQGVTQVVVNAHHLADQVQAFARARMQPPRLDVVVEPELLGTAGGVRNALPLLGDEPFLVLYGDVMTDTSLGQMLADHRRSRAQVTLAVYRSTETEGKGTIDVDAQSGVTRFREKEPPTGDSALINAGLYVMDAEFVRAYVGPGGASDFGHDVFPAALERGATLRVHTLDRPVLDVGLPTTLASARARKLS